MQSIKINNKTFKAPAKWNEVDQKRLCRFASALFGDFDADMKINLAISSLFLLTVRYIRVLRPAHIILLKPRVMFALQRNNLTKWVITSIRVFFTRYYGPADALTNITAHEFFNYYEPLYWIYRNNPTPGNLNNFCAALYREKRKEDIDNDIRRSLTEAGIAKRTRKFRHVSTGKKLAIVFNYEGCRNFIAKRYKAAFTGKGTKKDIQGDVTLTIAGGALGTLKEARETNLYTFLLHLCEVIEQAENTKNA